MRVILLVALFAFPAAAQQRPFYDVDFYGGISHSTKVPFDDQNAPLFSLRVGIRPESWLSVGIRTDAAPGPEGVEVTFQQTQQRAGHEWYSASADARLLLTSPHELYLGAGVGGGHVASLQCDCQEQYAVHGSGPLAYFAAGGRLATSGTLRFGAEFRAAHWWGLETRGGVNSPSPIPPLHTTDAWFLLLTLGLGWSF